MCVIALHIALYLVLRGSAGWQMRAKERSPSPRAEVTLRLLPWREPSAAASTPPTPRAVEPAPIRPPQGRVSQAITTAPPAATSAVAVVAPALASTQTSAAPMPGLPASQPPRPLELTLPSGYATRPGARNLAIDDPRANSARTTPEQRMAAAFDTQVIEEDLGDGRRRVRRGADCVIVKTSRIAQLMPFNEAAARTPSLVGACP
jgi:hypothetical protein